MALTTVLALTSPVSRAETLSPDAGPVLVDEIVAILRDSANSGIQRAVLLSDLFLEARLVAFRQSGPAAFFQPPEPKGLSAALDHYIDEWVVSQEASRLQVFPVPTEEIDQALAKLRQTLGPKKFDAFLDQEQIDPATVREILERGMRAQRYLEGRFRGSARANEAEISAWYDAHRAELGGRSLAQAHGDIAEQLTRAHLARLSADFTADVRRRARVRVLHDPAAPATELRLSGSASATSIAGEGTSR